MKQVLLGTRNHTRKEYVQEILKDLKIKILTLTDLNITKKIDETANSEIENSKIKAIGYFKEANIPTLSIDAGLYIDTFPTDKQPGAFAKRIYGDSTEATDDAMLDYYINQLNKYSGESSGQWKIAITLVNGLNNIKSTTFERKTFFTSTRCQEFNLGEPLNSIQIDKPSGKYIAQLSPIEKKNLQKDLADHIETFIKLNL